MKKVILLALTIICASGLSAQDVYINEVDYDQPGTDNAEFIELVGLGGTSLDGYEIILVNGANGAEYNSITLDGFFIPDDDINGFGFFVIGPLTGVANVDYTPTNWDTDEIQNGGSDGILLKLNGLVVDGISYEGVISNNSDFTSGMAISATENNSEPNLSLGRILLGFDDSNQDQFFSASAASPSPGLVNTSHGQTVKS